MRHPVPVLTDDDPPPGEQRPVMIEPRAHAALWMNLDSLHTTHSFVDLPELPIEGMARAQHELDVERSPRRKRCDRCNLRQAVRGQFNAEQQWTMLLCRVCMDSSGDNVRRTTLLLNARCVDCTRTAAFGPPHGTNTLVLPPSEMFNANRTIVLRSVALHCKLHRAAGEVLHAHAHTNARMHVGCSTPLCLRVKIRMLYEGTCPCCQVLGFLSLPLPQTNSTQSSRTQAPSYSSPHPQLPLDARSPLSPRRWTLSTSGAIGRDP